jgi:hypothetical protein
MQQAGSGRVSRIQQLILTEAETAQAPEFPFAARKVEKGYPRVFASFSGKYQHVAAMAADRAPLRIGFADIAFARDLRRAMQILVGAGLKDRARSRVHGPVLPFWLHSWRLALD